MSETVIELLIDYSGSMGYMKGGGEEENKYLIGGKTRFSIIKKAILEDILPSLDYCSTLFIKLFRQEVSTSNNGKVRHEKLDIKSVYEGEYNIESIRNKLLDTNDPHWGGTPIGQAMYHSIKNMEKYPKADRKIILITDGEENAEGDYAGHVNRLSNLQGTTCKVFVLGIALSQSAINKAKTIASGGFYNIQSETFSSKALRTALAPLKLSILKDSNENSSTESGNKKQTIESKIEAIKNEARLDPDVSFSTIEKKISEYVKTGETLLDEIAELKEKLRIQSVINSGLIDSTTLTIDEDYSESIRKQSEAYVNQKLIEIYGIDNVNWMNENEESFESFDFKVTTNEGSVKYIEVKGTIKDKPTFYLTKKEWKFFRMNSVKYEIWRVSNLGSSPTHMVFSNLLEDLLEGKLVPYLKNKEILKEERVFLTVV